MPARNVADAPLRDLLAAGARVGEGSRILADRRPVEYFSTEPVHRAAVEVEALRHGLHVIAATHPNLSNVLSLVDDAADELSRYAETAGL